MDTIIVEELEVFYRVGVPVEERSRPQRLLLTLEMEFNVTRAAKSDDIADTLDYYAVSRELLNFGEGREWHLIEKTASDIAEMILSSFKAAGVRVEVKKFILPVAKHVAVRIERKRYN